MDHYNTIRRWGNIARGVLLFFTFLSLVTYIVWDQTCKRASFSTMDPEQKFFVDSYRKHFEKKLEKAIRHLKTADTNKYDKLILFLSDIETIKKMDRLDPVKRKGLEIISQSCFQENNYEEALFWTNKWLEFDDRDLYAALQKAEILYCMPEKKEEGISLFRTFYQKLPEVEFIARAYGDMQFREGNYAEAVCSYYRLLTLQDRLEKWGWEIYWDIGNGFNANHKKSIFPESFGIKGIRFSLELSPGVTRLRIDPFLFANRVILNPVLTFGHKGEEEKIRLNNYPLRFNEMTQKGDLLVISNERDPFFSFDVPEKWRHTKFRMTLNAQVEVDYPAYLTKIYSLPNRLAIRKEVFQKGGENAAIFFDRFSSGMKDKQPIYQEPGK